MYLRLPPKIKVLEAASTLADSRIKVLNDKEAIVKSSDGSREYYVFLDINKGEACSTDNGTVYRKYIGYPIIAFLMIKGILPYNEKVGNALKGIKWRELNEKFKKYSLVEEEIKKLVFSKGVSPVYLDMFKEKVYNILKSRIRLRLSSKCSEKLTK